MKTIAIMNQKGGVGKTTTAVTLAHGLARRGYPTLLVDLDAQGNVADALGLDKGPGLHRLLVEGYGRRAVVLSRRRNLSLILGDKHTVQVKQHLTVQPFSETLLARALEDLANLYTVTILDVAPGVDILQISALAAADYFIIPVALDHLAVVGAGDALASAAGLKQIGGLRARFLGILPTFWERTTNESHTQLSILAQQFQRLVWPPIPRDVKAREAPAHGQTLWEYGPGCRALEGVRLNGHTNRTGGYRQALTRLLTEVT